MVPKIAGGPRTFKICTTCGRQFAFRKKWRLNWEQVKFCSDACRKNKKSPDFRPMILTLLHERGPKVLVSPEEILLELGLDSSFAEPIRRSARLLSQEGFVEIVQNSRVVDASEFKGAIQLRLKK